MEIVIKIPIVLYLGLVQQRSSAQIYLQLPFSQRLPGGKKRGKQ
jgi:hypothetical protein